MSRGRGRRWLVLSALHALGCGADLGGGAGVEVRTPAAIGYGRLAASTKVGTPLNDRGILIGALLESRFQSKLGVRFDTGIMVGWGSGPAAIGGQAGFESFLEVGTPIESGLLRHGDWFAGAACALPLSLSAPRQVQDLNSSTWFATNRLELVPSLRARLHFDHPDGGDLTTKIDLTGGVALRLRILSDLF